MNNLEKILTEEIFPLVSKPGRYIGNEFNIIKKDWSKVDVSFGLVFPDLYELGMSYIGFEILYHILNRESNLAAERIFAPGIDLEKILRERDLPLFSLETKKPLRQFDVLGFTLQYELHYTNILNILDLGGITLQSKERKNDEPLVIAGGPCAFNPEPLADFMDGFVVGDGEEVVLEIAQLIKEKKERHSNRQDILQGLANITGVYVPQFYQVSNGVITPRLEGLPTKITARTIQSLSSQNYPDNPLIPHIEVTHDRYSMEIMRGCTRGCRFCNAGIVYRPVREIDVQDLVSKAINVIKNTGYEEISLVSLSTSDYSQLHELLNTLIQTLNKKMVNVSFPSLRAETFTPEIAKFAKTVKKSGITLAPEAGTDHLRKVINKNNTTDDLLRAVTVAFDEGWNLIKLYFMIGHPDETDEDLFGIVSLINQIVSIAQKYQGRNVNVSISPFSPKPHTPFQWVAQNSIDELKRKISLLNQEIRSKRVKLNWREPEVSFLEAVLGRGDRRLSGVIKKAWELGAKFDAWSEHFDFEIWRSAFEACGIDPQEYVRARDLDENLPWDHISKGVTKSFLKNEFQKAFNEDETSDCKTSGCNACGLMKHQVCQEIIHQKKPALKSVASTDSFGRSKRLVKATVPPSLRHIRLRYSKGDEIRFTSHLDMIRIFERSFRRSDINLAYSQGFHPHPKIAFGPPLSLGFMSQAEYLDVQLYREYDADIGNVLNKKLPSGIEILASKTLFGKYDSLVSVINRAEYKIIFKKAFDQSYLKQQITEFLNRTEIWIDREKKEGIFKIDIRPYIDEIVLDTYPNTLFLTTTLNQGKTARISEILSELLSLTAEEIALTKIIRTGQYVIQGDAKLTPLEI